MTDAILEEGISTYTNIFGEHFLGAVLVYLAVAAVLAIIVPLAMSIYVSRDAKKRCMSGVAWGLLTFFVPSYLGFIIYLAVRKNRAQEKCAFCGGYLNAETATCPTCGAPTKNICFRCGMPLENGMETCPKCGQPIPPEQAMAVNAEHIKVDTNKTDKGFIAVMVIAFLVPTVFFFSSLGFTGYVFSQVADVIAEDIDEAYEPVQAVSREDAEKVEVVKDWLKTCDEDGDGVYVLEAIEKNDGYCNSRFIIYSVGKTYTANAKSITDFLGFSNDGKTEIKFKLSESEAASGIMAYESYYDNGACELTFFDDKSNVLDFKKTTVKDYDALSELMSEFLQERDVFYFCADISRALSERVGKFEIKFYDGKKEVTTKDVKPSDIGYGVTAELTYDGKAEFDKISFNVYGKDGKLIFESYTYEVRNSDSLFVSLEYDKNGEISIIDDEYYGSNLPTIEYVD